MINLKKKKEEMYTIKSFKRHWLNKRMTERNSYCSNNNNLTPDMGTPVKGPDFCKNKI